MKPADLELHCFQNMIIVISRLSMIRVLSVENSTYIFFSDP